MNIFLKKYLDIWLLIFRLAVAGFMMLHGWGKLTKLVSGDLSFADPIGLGEPVSLVLVVFSEFLCSLFIGLGLFTRWATIPLIITMLVAAFITHGADPFTRKEMSLMYFLIYGTILFVGPGKYSLDTVIFNRKISKAE